MPTLKELYDKLLDETYILFHKYQESRGKDAIETKKEYEKSYSKLLEIEDKLQQG